MMEKDAIAKELEVLTERLNGALRGREYEGELSQYVRRSIVQGTSNYGVKNLIEFCNGAGLTFTMTDMATEEVFELDTVAKAHQTIDKLMKRYDVDCMLVYRKTACYYTLPRKKDGKGEERKYPESLSVKTLVAVCQVIHCELRFYPN